MDVSFSVSLDTVFVLELILEIFAAATRAPARDTLRCALADITPICADAFVAAALIWADVVALDALSLA